MSTIAGVLYLDGRPAISEDLSRLSRHLSHRLADTERRCIDGPMGVVVRVLHTTAEAAREQQPWCDARLVVGFDGRLDNRGELIEALDPPIDENAAPGDAALVAHAYRRWGVDCASHLLGDFAFVVWDRVERRLYGARDIFGVRPFYYRLDTARLLFAPEPHALLRCDGTSPAPNEGVVGEFLANAVCDQTETLLAGIMRLPPAHAFVADSRGVRISRYWDIDPSRDICYKDEHEYAEHLQALLREAVTARLRAAGPVAILLSSGLDSSTVLGVARTVSGPDAALRAYTLSAPGAADESPAARLTAEHWGVPHHVEAADLSGHLPLVDEVERYLDLPDYPSTSVAAPLRAQVRADGARVVLTGMASDDWFGGSLFRYADQLRDGALWPLARSMWRARHSENFDGWYSTFRAACWPLVPSPARRVVLRSMGRSGVPPMDRPGVRATDQPRRPDPHAAVVRRVSDAGSLRRLPRGLQRLDDACTGVSGSVGSCARPRASPSVL